jgi:cytochrome P450 family 4
MNGSASDSGTSVSMLIYGMHLNPDVFEDPEAFKPERFLPENGFQRHRYSFVPFSAGPRNCIGQKFAMLEIKVVLSASPAR